jgi:hypothetical protein
MDLPLPSWLDCEYDAIGRPSLRPLPNILAILRGSPTRVGYDNRDRNERRWYLCLTNKDEDARLQLWIDVESKWY